MWCDESDDVEDESEDVEDESEEAEDESDDVEDESEDVEDGSVVWLWELVWGQGMAAPALVSLSSLPPHLALHSRPPCGLLVAENKS